MGLLSSKVLIRDGWVLEKLVWVNGGVATVVGVDRLGAGLALAGVAVASPPTKGQAEGTGVEVAAAQAKLGPHTDETVSFMRLVGL